MNRHSIPAGAAFALMTSVAFAQITERVSVSTAGAEGDGISGRTSAPAVDASGLVVAFDSEATTLVAGDTNLAFDVFVHDRRTGTTLRVSVDGSGVQGNGASTYPSVSGDGRFVAFHSTATNLVSGDTNSAMDVFLHDLQTGATERVSVSSAGTQGAGASFYPSVSGDGRYVAFLSDAANLVANDTNGTRDVFIRDRVAGTTERVSLASNGTPSNSDCAPPAISPDGRYVVFASFASNLAAGDTNTSFDVFLRDRVAGTTERVSVDSAGAEGNGASTGGALSADGRYVAFESDATNLVASDTNGVRDMFVRDRVAATTERVNVGAGGVQADSQSGFSIGGRSTIPVISADGRFVAFDSSGRNLVAGDTNMVQDVFVRDRLAGTTYRASVDSSGVQGIDGSTDPAISADGLTVAFISKAWNLVPGDTNRCGGFQTPGQCVDVFVNSRFACGPGTVNAGAGAVADVLRVNGFARVASVALGARIDVTLGAAPAGPNPARYALWIWPGLPSSPTEIMAHGQRVGCTVDPSPLRRGARPQPVLCLVTPTLPTALCQGVGGVSGAPLVAPWMLSRPTGLSHAATFTLQGLLEDAGTAAPAVGFSVTNAVILEVR
jgi:Tol biopolymer transport system component